MTSRERPETIENWWPLLYSDYPDVYEEWTKFTHDPDPDELVCTMFDFQGKEVLDVGSGTGVSTFKVARHARRVIGLEPEAAMRETSLRQAQQVGLTNVTFLEGASQNIPLPDASVDIVTAFTAPLDVPESERVLRPGGLVISLDIAPGWYGGELDSVIGDENELEDHSRELVARGFSFTDIDSIQEYGTTENILRTYGFIFGRNAIDHLKRTGQTTIRWKFRIHYKQKPA
jgi:ubiquinone/menaquinone biosynthesis C-methylase UbiE